MKTLTQTSHFCPLCKGCFSNEKKLYRHVALHDRYNVGAMPFSCSKCTKTLYTFKGALRHMKRHMGIGHRCDECEFITDSLNSYIEHKRVHTGEKPHSCKSCSASYARIADLHRHEREIHLGVTHKCSLCHAEYPRLYSLHIHIQYKHTKRGMVSALRHEEKVHSYLVSNDISCDKQVHVNFNCFATEGRRAFVDFAISRPWGSVLLEVDEGQHKHYGISCEARRMSDIMSSLVAANVSGKVHFVRYNPDDFTINNTHKRIDSNARRAFLLSLINMHEPVNTFEITYCFYDSIMDHEKLFPSILGAEEFPDSLSNLVNCHLYPIYTS